MAPIRTSSLIAKEKTKKDPTIEKLDILNEKLDILNEKLSILLNTEYSLVKKINVAKSRKPTNKGDAQP